MAHELVIISGKGGPGKTSILASFAALADTCAVADADVDAADLHLLLEPTVVHREQFSAGSSASIVPEKCTSCGMCRDLCRFDAVTLNGQMNGTSRETFRVDPIACEGCGVCAFFCPEKAIDFSPVVNGELFLSETRFGPMVHARLGVAQENSGKLVSLVRERARAMAEARKLDFVLIDGSPGIGCPVIASITGADRVLIVTEPTLSGLHDLGRVADLTRHFKIDTYVAINKWDLNEEITSKIETVAQEGQLTVAGKIRYDPAVTTAQVHARTIVEHRCEAADDVRSLWSNMKNVRHKYGLRA